MRRHHRHAVHLAQPRRAARARDAPGSRRSQAAAVATGADGIVARRVPAVTEHTATLGDQPVFWRDAADGPATRPSRLYLHGVPTRERRLGARSSRAPAASRPTCPASAAAASAATATSRSSGYARFVERFLDLVDVDRVASSSTTGARSGCVGPALPRARRAPRGRSTRSRCCPATAGTASRARGARRVVGEVAMGFAIRRAGPARRCPAAVAEQIWPFFDQGTQRAILRLYRASPEERWPRAGLDLGRDRLPRARRVGRSRPVRARRASPTPTPPRSAARPRSCTCPTPATGRGRSARMSSTRSPRSWTRLRHAPAWPLAAVAAGLWLIAPPATGDMTAQRYRASLGLVVWDNGWYGGHHMPGYSVALPAAGLDRWAARGRGAERGGARRGASSAWSPTCRAGAWPRRGSRWRR